MRLCDGRRTVAAVVDAFASLGELDLDVPATPTQFGLGYLRDQGFVAFSAGPTPSSDIEPSPVPVQPNDGNVWPPHMDTACG